MSIQQKRKIQLNANKKLFFIGRHSVWTDTPFEYKFTQHKNIEQFTYWSVFDNIYFWFQFSILDYVLLTLSTVQCTISIRQTTEIIDYFSCFFFLISFCCFGTEQVEYRSLSIYDYFFLYGLCRKFQCSPCCLRKVTFYLLN